VDPLTANRTEESLRDIKGIKIGDIFFRAVPLHWIGNPTSTEGAKLRGGRYNPPAALAPSSEFGFLYTASDPITCLYECGHILRGTTEPKVVPVQPTGLVSFTVEAESVLDLTSKHVIEALGLDPQLLVSVDTRYVQNDRGAMTALQKLGSAVYKTGRFVGILAPSQFKDRTGGTCLNFLPGEVQLLVHDVAGDLKRIKFESLNPA
jgi:RES domain-containing protein